MIFIQNLAKEDKYIPFVQLLHMEFILRQDRRWQCALGYIKCSCGILNRDVRDGVSILYLIEW